MFRMYSARSLRAGMNIFILYSMLLGYALIILTYLLTVTF